MSTNADFEYYFARWALTPDGDPIVTDSSLLIPVRRDGALAMLKIAVEAEERWGAALMVWWDGIGAARVLEHDENAILLERATGKSSLIEMAKDGRDDEASRIICDVVAKLHAPRGKPLPELVPLTQWFRALEPVAAREGGLFVRCAETARTLLADPRDTVALHGDIHHGNILDFAEQGWLAIDPKRLGGERGFDYANLFCNPDYLVATAPGRLARQADVVAQAAKLERKRLLQWILAWAGLSAAWGIEDGDRESVGPVLQVAEIAAAELDRSAI
ncbi:MAG: aminoglycoside phosphotransferase family protein [Pseudomonadota bacterium]